MSDSDNDSPIKEGESAAKGDSPPNKSKSVKFESIADTRDEDDQGFVDIQAFRDYFKNKEDVPICVKFVNKDHKKVKTTQQYACKFSCSQNLKYFMIMQIASAFPG